MGSLIFLMQFYRKQKYPRPMKNTNFWFVKPLTPDRAHLIEETLSPFSMPKSRTYKLTKLSFLFDLEGGGDMFFRTLMLCPNYLECCI
jgi:hypothetical protein